MTINNEIINFYIIMITICAIASSLLTEAIKVACKNAGKQWSSNLIALINAIIVGGGVPIIFYIYNDVPWNLKSILTIFCLAILTWIGSIIGFDKVKQMLVQIKGEEEKDNK